MAKSTIEMAFKDPAHNHEACIEDALALADKICERRGARLTDLRRRVLAIVWNTPHTPIGAYDIIAALGTQGHTAVPTTVYRVLAFLEEQNLIHRVESLNAYIGCAKPDTPHSVQFQICRECKSVAALDDPAFGEAMDRSAKRTGFKITSSVIEINGICPNCQEKGLTV